MGDYQFEHDYPKIVLRLKTEEEWERLRKVIERWARKRRKEEKSK